MGSLERVGWLFFIAGSVVFTLVGIINHDWWTMAGGALYVVGCGVLWMAAKSTAASATFSEDEAAK